jgi:phosphoribosylformylglycinamidine synthase PurS subunit
MYSNFEIGVHPCSFVVPSRISMKAKIIVRLKQTVHDPQGEAIFQAFQHMGYSKVNHVRQGKIFDIEVAGKKAADVRSLLEELARKVLANPIIEEYVIELGEES